MPPADNNTASTRMPAGKVTAISGEPVPNMDAFYGTKAIEISLLGDLFASEDPVERYHALSGSVDADSWTSEGRRKVWLSIGNVVSLGEPLTMAMVFDDLVRHRWIDGVSLTPYKDQPKLIDTIRDAYVRKMVDATTRRKLALTVHDLSTRVANPAEDIGKITADARKKLDGLETQVLPTDLDSVPSVFEFTNAKINFVVDGFFAEGAIHLVSGQPGDGKSSLLQSAGWHVSHGQSFLGRAVTQRKVFYFDRENGVDATGERLRRLGIQDGGPFSILGSWLSSGPVEPDAPEMLRYIIRAERKPLIIVDSLSAYLGADENDSQAIRAFFNRLRTLADAGASIIIIHHVGKAESSKNYRGSSDIAAAIDVGLVLTNNGGTVLDRLNLKPFKSRFTVRTDMSIRYRDGEFVSDDRPVAVAQDDASQLSVLLDRNPNISKSKFYRMGEAAGIPQHRVRDWVSQYIAAGWISVLPGPGAAQRIALKKIKDELQGTF